MPYTSSASFSSNAGYLAAAGYSTINGALCNIYIFSDTTPDSLDLGSPFTGNLKVQIASDSETGIHPDIIAGRQKAFVASTDVKNDPQWVQYEIEAVAIPWLVDTTYNGRIAYAKDDVWSYLNMGAPETRFYYDFDGVSAYILLATPYAWGENEDISLRASLSTTSTSQQVILGQSSTDNWYLNMEATGEITLSGLITSVDTYNDGLPHTIEVRRVGAMITLLIDEVIIGTANRNWEGWLDVIGRNVYGLYFEGTIYDVSLGGEVILAVDDGWASNPTILNTGTGDNATLINGIEVDWYESIK